MKLWIPIATAVLVVAAYSFVYEQSSVSLGLVNAVGLVVVLVGLIAAGFILRRGAPPPESPPKTP